MVRRNAVHAMSSLPSRYWWPQQRRKGKRVVVRLGNRRRGFFVGPPRMVVQRWRMNIGKPMKMMRSIILGILSSGGNVNFLDAYLWSLPILRGRTEMAAITALALRSPVFLPPSSATTPRFHGFTKLPPPARLFFPLKPFPFLSIQNPKSIRISASASPMTPTIPTAKSTTRSSTLTGSTRSLATLAALTIAVTRVLAQKLSLAIQTSSPAIADGLRFSLSTAGPVFFASLRDRPPGYLNTPLTVVAVGIKKWLDIYSGVLMVRVLLSWFPNIPWERQPLSAIRDLCDPYLNLFRNIIPPIFDTLDVSPLLAFAVLGTLGSIVHGSTG
ncbi:unnamed protein product [Arabidopsis arenosa]|uniref:YGGT family protein n=1 Tax=Arabidopsis arenosa TaxID=38785 RepID=A0A8S1ZTL5_ARAAE|nr:unnamed protein product [Arabidopsis arenosa]